MSSFIEAFSQHDELNPKIWDNSTQILIPDVREKLLEIANAFYKTLDLKFDVADILLVGSNASYNYTKDSDLDIHLVCNFDLIDASQEIAQLLFNCKKNEFNSRHDISIKGIPVEVYVEDINSATLSNGIYSVMNNKWIKKPTKETFKYIEIGEKPIEKLVEKIRNIVTKQDVKLLRETINSLYMMRKNSLSIDGEYGKGNLLFKELRARGILDELRTALDDAISKNLSLESMN